jgi:hypothetical protein
MFSVLFEVHPKPDRWDAYVGYAKMLRPELEAVDGFVDNIGPPQKPSKPGTLRRTARGFAASVSCATTACSTGARRRSSILTCRALTRTRGEPPAPIRHERARYG